MQNDHKEKLNDYKDIKITSKTQQMTAKILKITRRHTMTTDEQKTSTNRCEMTTK